MDAFKSLVTGGPTNAILDGMKLVVLGGTVETARRATSNAWSSFVNSFFLTAHFSDQDFPYDWLMLWLSRRPEWQGSREFETVTRTDKSKDPTEEVGEDGVRVVFQPTLDSTHTIYFRGHWLRVTRSRRTDEDGDREEVLTISVVARNNNILKALVLQAKREYEAEAVHKIQIYTAERGYWRWADSRHKRPMKSIVLNPGVKEMLLNDANDFLVSEQWYADRGIPFRRGYLLWGVPGSGKTSLIHAMAGELGLDIYVASLSASWVNDTSIVQLLGRVPSRCILLLEDLDAAFTHSVASRKDKKDKKEGPKTKRQREKMGDQNSLSLGGLLNALDGVAATEGRILFATTNHLDALDPALSRPGRMDVWVEFKNASKHQAEGLFRNFFPVEPTPDADDPPIEPSPETEPESESEGQDHDRNALDEKTLDCLTKMWMDAIPDEEFSIAELQGYLLKNKGRPRAAAREAKQWVIDERIRKEKQKQEKEEREKKQREEEEREQEEESKEEQNEGDNNSSDPVPPPPEDDEDSESDV